MHLVTYFIWLILAPAIYALVPRTYAIWIVLIGGWLLLPPAIYAATGNISIFPFWIIGSALPDEHLITKAWVAPAIAILASLFFERERWVRLHWHWSDIVLLAFCFWPTAQSLFVEEANPRGWISSVYLTGVWVLPWLIGRLYLRNRRDAKSFAAVLAIITAIMLPVIIAESILTFRVHTALFDTHPFAFDGAPRYVGYRPQLFFEHGNQYGLWCAGATIAAFWRLKEATPTANRWWMATFLALLAITVASQSIGAILLMIGAVAMLSFPKSFRLARALGAVGVTICLLLATLYVSKAVSLRNIAENTSIGQAVVSGIRATGRGSFVWRFGQDLKTLPLIEQKPILGSAHWNWFMPVDSRPWGLPLLIVGQFGLVGLCLLTVAILGALSRHLKNAARDSPSAQLFTVMLLLFGLDAFLNSFLFYPALMIAGAFTHPGMAGKHSKIF